MEHQMEKVAAKHDRSGQIVALLGPLIGLVTVILAKSTDLGPSAWIPLMLVAVCSAYVVFGQPSVGVLRRALKALGQHYLVPKYLSQLEGLAKRLQRSCDPHYSDNVPYVLRDYQTLWGAPCGDSSVTGYLAGLVSTFLFTLSGSHQSKTNLVVSLRWFGVILDMYNRQSVCEPVREIINHLEQGLDEDKKLRYQRLRREYSKVLHGYVTFLEDCARFARDLNSAFGENLAGEYFQRPDELGEPSQWICKAAPVTSQNGNAGSSA
jgi:hypothetical protein